MSFLNSYQNLNSNISNATDVVITGDTSIDSINNITIGGGSNGYLLITDSQGNINWINPLAAPVANGPANSIQYNLVGDFQGSDVTWNNANNTLAFNATSATVTTNSLSVSGQSNITGNLYVSGGQTGEVIVTNGSNVLQWQFPASGFGFPSSYTPVGTVQSNATVGANTVTVSNVILSANVVVTFGDAFNYYVVSNTTPSGGNIILNLGRSLVANVSVGSNVNLVQVDTVDTIQFSGTIDSDYPPISGGNEGNVRVTPGAVFLEQNLRPSLTPPSSGYRSVIFANNGTYFSNSTVSINDTVGSVAINTLAISGAANVANAINLNGSASVIRTTGNSNINITGVNGNDSVGSGNISSTTLMTVDNALYTPNQTVAQSYNTNRDYAYSFSQQPVFQNVLTPNGKMAIVAPAKFIGFQSYDGKYYNWSAGPMVLMVSWQTCWENNTNKEGQNYWVNGWRYTWLAINGDNNAKRYGGYCVNNTGYEYRVGALITRSYFGPTAQTATTIIRLNPGDYFQIYYQQPEATSDEAGNASYVPVGGTDPQYEYVAGSRPYNSALGIATGTQRVSIQRLDSNY